MAETEGPVIEAYIVARFAEWAGDRDHSRRLYAECGGRRPYNDFPKRFDGPLEVIRFVSELRAARLGEPVSDGTRVFAAKVFATEGHLRSLPPPEPMLLTPTRHLRAAVHRVGNRDFQMRAYLDRLEFEPRLYENARRVGTAAVQTASAETIGDRVYDSPGVTWVIEGRLFQKVTVSDFGLIKSEGRWTQQELPRTADEVLRPFQRLLEALDPAEKHAASKR